jgi:excinuclease ABC subunit C
MLLEPTPVVAAPGAARAGRGVLEERLQNVLDTLSAEARADKFSAEQLSEHLALLARWYYRAPARRAGEIFFADEAGGFPPSKILRGISRVFCGQKEVSETVNQIASLAAGDVPAS